MTIISAMFIALGAKHILSDPTELVPAAISFGLGFLFLVMQLFDDLSVKEDNE